MPLESKLKSGTCNIKRKANIRAYTTVYIHIHINIHIYIYVYTHIHIYIYVYLTFLSFDLESDFLSAVGAELCPQVGTEVLIPSANGSWQLQAFSWIPMAWLSVKVTKGQSHGLLKVMAFSKSQSLSGPTASNDYFMWDYKSLDLLLYIRTNSNSHSAPELPKVSMKAFVGTESQFSFPLPRQKFLFLTHRCQFWDTSLINILYANLCWESVSWGTWPATHTEEILEAYLNIKVEFQPWFIYF